MAMSYQTSLQATHQHIGTSHQQDVGQSYHHYYHSPAHFAAAATNNNNNNPPHLQVCFNPSASANLSLSPSAAASIRTVDRMNVSGVSHMSSGGGGGIFLDIGNTAPSEVHQGLCIRPFDATTNYLSNNGPSHAYIHEHAFAQTLQRSGPRTQEPAFPPSSNSNNNRNSNVFLESGVSGYSAAAMFASHHATTSSFSPNPAAYHFNSESGIFATTAATTATNPFATSYSPSSSSRSASFSRGGAFNFDQNHSSSTGQPIDLGDSSSCYAPHRRPTVAPNPAEVRIHDCAVPNAHALQHQPIALTHHNATQHMMLPAGNFVSTEMLRPSATTLVTAHKEHHQQPSLPFPIPQNGVRGHLDPASDLIHFSSPYTNALSTAPIAYVLPNQRESTTNNLPQSTLTNNYFGAAPKAAYPEPEVQLIGTKDAWKPKSPKQPCCCCANCEESSHRSHKEEAAVRGITTRNGNEDEDASAESFSKNLEREIESLLSDGNTIQSLSGSLLRCLQGVSDHDYSAPHVGAGAHTAPSTSTSPVCNVGAGVKPFIIHTHTSATQQRANFVEGSLERAIRRRDRASSPALSVSDSDEEHTERSMGYPRAAKAPAKDEVEMRSQLESDVKPLMQPPPLLSFSATQPWATHQESARNVQAKHCPHCIRHKSVANEQQTSQARVDTLLDPGNSRVPAATSISTRESVAMIASGVSTSLAVNHMTPSHTAFGTPLGIGVKTDRTEDPRTLTQTAAARGAHPQEEVFADSNLTRTDLWPNQRNWRPSTGLSANNQNSARSHGHGFNERSFGRMSLEAEGGSVILAASNLSISSAVANANAQATSYYQHIANINNPGAHPCQSGWGNRAPNTSGKLPFAYDQMLIHQHSPHAPTNHANHYTQMQANMPPTTNTNGYTFPLTPHPIRLPHVSQDTDRRYSDKSANKQTLRPSNLIPTRPQRQGAPTQDGSKAKCLPTSRPQALEAAKDPQHQPKPTDSEPRSVEQFGNEGDEKLEPEGPFKTLLVNFIANTVTVDEIDKLFSAIGPLEGCRIIKDRKTNRSKGYAFVYYKTPGDAERAKQMLGGEVGASASAEPAQINDPKLQEIVDEINRNLPPSPPPGTHVVLPSAGGSGVSLKGKRIKITFSTNPLNQMVLAEERKSEGKNDIKEPTHSPDLNCAENRIWM